MLRRALGSGRCCRILIYAPPAAAAHAAGHHPGDAACRGGAAARDVHRRRAHRTAHWDFGDGTSADGVTVSTRYAAGRWTATATATGDGSTLTQSVPITAYGLTLRGPQRRPIRAPASSAARSFPAERGLR